MQPKRNSFTKDTIIISLFNALGVFTSFAIDISLAGIFGLGLQTDAFFVAATIPLLTYVIFNRVAELALVPLFVMWETKYGQQKWLPFSILLLMSLGALTAVSLIAILLSNLLFTAIAPGLSRDAQMLTVSLGRLMLLIIPLNGIIAICRAQLNANKAFAASTSSNLIRNGMVLVFVVWAYVNAQSILSIATGYVFAAIAQCLALFIFLRKYNFKFHLNFNFRHPEVQNARQQLLFPLFSFSVNQSNEIVERLLASFLPAGSLSSLVFARRIVGIIVNIFLGSPTSVIIPSLAKLAAKKDLPKLQETLRHGVKIVLLIAFPLLVWGLLLNEPLVRLTFMRGAIEAEHINLIASLVELYVIALPVLGLIQLLMAPHYALGDVRTPALHLLLMISIQLSLDLLLFWLWGIWGIPIALGLTAVISVSRGLWLLKQKNIAVLDTPLLVVIGKLLIICFSMSLSIYLINQQWGQSNISTTLWSELSITIISILISSIVLLVVAKLLRLIPFKFAIT